MAGTETTKTVMYGTKQNIYTILMIDYSNRVHLIQPKSILNLLTCKQQLEIRDTSKA